MSYAAPFSLLSFYLPDRDDLAEKRLTWPLAGSLAIHVVVLITFLILRFASSLEQSSGSYEVTLVTLPEISASPTASPEDKSRPARNTDKVPPPKAAPQRKAISPPTPASQETSRVPERVTDSLVGALDSVVLPEPQVLALHQETAPLPPPPLPPLPVSANPKPKQNAGQIPLPQADDAEAPRPERVSDSLVSPLDSVIVPKPQAPALPQEVESVQAPVRPSPPSKQVPAEKMDVQPIQAPPQPPELVIEKPEAPTPSPRAAPLAQRLKQAIAAINVPRKPEQTSKPVTSTVTSEGEPKQDTTKTPRSSDITLPSRPPRLAAVSPPQAPKKEMPLQEATRKSSTVESLEQAIQSVRIPERISEAPQPAAKAAPLVPEALLKQPRTAEIRDVPSVVPPEAPPLAKVAVDQTLVASESAVPETSSESDTFKRRLDEISIPETEAFSVQSASRQTESGTQETMDLRVAGFCSPKNPYWENVEDKIDKIHRSLYRYHYRVESPAILTFRVMRNGQVADLAVVQSSKNKKFDLLAENAVLAAFPLPPFPATLTQPFCQVQHKFKINPNR